ncbi:MAG: DUF1499 domain-containing protein [Rhodospirillaceae bacterium]|nr:DUF1499 domain-containing protein [Rhodospirillaceae bacterium]
MSTFLIALAVLVAVPVLGYFGLAVAVGRDAVWETLLGPVGHPPVDFSDPPEVVTPNSHLVCPDGWCDGRQDAESPVFPVSMDELRAAWRAAMADLPHVTPLPALSDGDTQWAYEARTPLLRFPDTLTVRFIALDPADGQPRSTLAVLSRSHYGHGDVGANRARVERLFAAVAARLAAYPSASSSVP